VSCMSALRRCIAHARGMGVQISVSGYHMHQTSQPDGYDPHLRSGRVTLCILRCTGCASAQLAAHTKHANAAVQTANRRTLPLMVADLRSYMVSMRFVSIKWPAVLELFGLDVVLEFSAAGQEKQLASFAQRHLQGCSYNIARIIVGLI
jgi:hypothetical protein